MDFWSAKDSVGSSSSTMQSLLHHPVVASIVQNPINLGLFAVLLYLLIPVVAPLPLKKLAPTIDEARKINAAAASYRLRGAGGDGYSFLPSEHPKSSVWRVYTPKSLAVFDGTGGEMTGQRGSGAGHAASDNGQGANTILLSINRKVFDVTTGARFYGPGGPYGNFAGRDASRGMAKQSFDAEMLTPLDKPIDDLQDLTHTEKVSMREWEGHFTSKYPVVGELVDDVGGGDNA